jgi:hypothetical protein
MGRLATCPSRILTWIASMNITGYTGSKGRFCHPTMPSMTLSVIVEIVCRDTSAPCHDRQHGQPGTGVEDFVSHRRLLPARPAVPAAVPLRPRPAAAADAGCDRPAERRSARIASSILWAASAVTAGSGCGRRVGVAAGQLGPPRRLRPVPRADFRPRHLRRHAPHREGGAASPGPPGAAPWPVPSASRQANTLICPLTSRERTCSTVDGMRGGPAGSRTRLVTSFAGWALRSGNATGPCVPSPGRVGTVR